MDIGTLINTLRAIIDLVQSNGLMQSIQSLNQAVARIQPTQVTVAQRQTILTQIEGPKQEVLERILAIGEGLPEETSIEALHALGADTLFGKIGVSRIESILEALPQGSPNVRSELLAFQQRIQKLIQLHASLASFSPNINDVKFETIEANIIDLHFKGKENVEDLKELERAAKKWNQVLHGFALLCRENNTSFRINGIKKGSLILELIAFGIIAKTLGEATIKVLDVIHKALEIQKLALEIKKLNHPDLASQEKAIENAAKIKVRTEASRITSELTQQHGWSPEDKREDVSAAVRHAVEHLIKFMNNGGEVQVRLLASNPNDRSIESEIDEKRRQVAQKHEEMERLSGNPGRLELVEGEDSHSTNGEAENGGGVTNPETDI